MASPMLIRCEEMKADFAKSKTDDQQKGVVWNAEEHTQAKENVPIILASFPLYAFVKRWRASFQRYLDYLCIPSSIPRTGESGNHLWSDTIGVREAPSFRLCRGRLCFGRAAQDLHDTFPVDKCTKLAKPRVQ